MVPGEWVGIMLLVNGGCLDFGLVSPVGGGLLLSSTRVEDARVSACEH